MERWADQENHPAPQWVGDRGIKLSFPNHLDMIKPYNPSNWHDLSMSFHALCRHIYQHEKPPVDHDFERMRGVVSVIFYNVDYPVNVHEIERGERDDLVKVALDKWNETLAS